MICVASQMMFSPWIRTGTSPEEFKRMNHGSLCSLSGRFTSCSSHFRAFSAIANRTCNDVIGVTPLSSTPWTAVPALRSQPGPGPGAGPGAPLPPAQHPPPASPHPAPPAARGGHGACRPPPRPPHLLRGEGLSPVVQHQRRHARGTGGRPAARNERRGTERRGAAAGGAGGLRGHAAAAVPTPPLEIERRGCPGVRRAPPFPPRCSEDSSTS